MQETLKLVFFVQPNAIRMTEWILQRSFAFMFVYERAQIKFFRLNGLI